MTSLADTVFTELAAASRVSSAAQYATWCAEDAAGCTYSSGELEEGQRLLFAQAYEAAHARYLANT